MRLLRLTAIFAVNLIAPRWIWYVLFPQFIHLPADQGELLRRDVAPPLLVVVDPLQNLGAILECQRFSLWSDAQFSANRIAVMAINDDVVAVVRPDNDWIPQTFSLYGRCERVVFLGVQWWK